jgi:hypothetical protein
MKNNSIPFKKDRQHHLSNWKASGKTQKAYCEQEGITYSTFCWWAKKSREKSSIKETPSGFVPLHMQELKAQVEINVGQITIKVFA